MGIFWMKHWKIILSCRKFIMGTKEINYQEIKKLREEIHFLKDRINLIEAALDIQEWKHDLSNSANPEQTKDDIDFKTST
jgi:hypothetical protein